MSLESMTACDCGEPTKEIAELLAKEGRERRHTTVEGVGGYCHVVWFTRDGSILAVEKSTLISPTQEFLDGKAAYTAEVAAQKEAVSLANTELDRIRDKRIAGEPLTADEQQYILDRVLGVPPTVEK